MTEENPYLAPTSPDRFAAPVRARSAVGILGTDHLSDEELARELEAGGRFVAFDYCVSFLFVTLHRTSKDACFVPAGKFAAWKGMRWTLLSLVAGWWGFPWGLLCTPVVIVRNLAGGHDVTAQVALMVLRRDEREAVDRIIEQARPDAPGPPSDPGDPGAEVPDALKQIRL